MLPGHGLIAWLAIFACTTSAEKLIMPDHLRGPAAILQHTCQEETGLKDAVIAGMVVGQLPEDREFKCHLHCMLEKVGMYDENNNIEFGLIWHIVPEEFKPKMQAVIDICNTIHGTDQCETAFLTLQCFTRTDPDIDISEWFTKDHI